VDSDDLNQVFVALQAQQRLILPIAPPATPIPQPVDQSLDPQMLAGFRPLQKFRQLHQIGEPPLAVGMNQEPAVYLLGQ